MLDEVPGHADRLGVSDPENMCDPMDTVSQRQSPCGSIQTKSTHRNASLRIGKASSIFFVSRLIPLSHYPKHHVSRLRGPCPD